MPLGRFHLYRHFGFTGENLSQQAPNAPVQQRGNYGPGVSALQGLGRFLPSGNMPPMPPGLERFMLRRGFRTPVQPGGPVQQPVSTEIGTEPRKKGIKDLLSRFGTRKKS